MKILRLCFLVGTIVFPGFAAAKELKVATFNIKWFGLGGSMTGSKSKEKRGRKIRAFMKENKLIDYDLIVFQEIVDIRGLQSQVLSNRFKCQSYKHFDKRHQHVVVCHKPKYEFVKEVDDTNFALEKVTLGRERSRPAVHGILKEHNKNILRVLGVHLKAFPNESKVRWRQAQVIGRHLESRDDQTPAIVLGDFNTYDSNKFGSDVEIISKIFAKSGLQIIENLDSYTYRNGSRSALFDHIWASTAISGVQSESLPVCQDYVKAEKGFYNTDYYNKNVSDHCPVLMTIEL